MAPGPRDAPWAYPDVPYYGYASQNSARLNRLQPPTSQRDPRPPLSALSLSPSRYNRILRRPLPSTYDSENARGTTSFHGLSRCQQLPTRLHDNHDLIEMLHRMSVGDNVRDFDNGRDRHSTRGSSDLRDDRYHDPYGTGQRLGGYSHHSTSRRSSRRGPWAVRFQPYDHGQAGDLGRDENSQTSDLHPQGELQVANSQDPLPLRSNHNLLDDDLYARIEPGDNRVRWFMDNHTQPFSTQTAPDVPEGQCPICLDTVDQHECVQLKDIAGCTHVFGRVCLQSWLDHDPEGKKDCPLCRANWLPEVGKWEDDPSLQQPADADAYLRRFTIISQQL